MCAFTFITRLDGCLLLTIMLFLCGVCMKGPDSFHQTDSLMSLIQQDQLDLKPVGVWLKYQIWTWSPWFGFDYLMVVWNITCRAMKAGPASGLPRDPCVVSAAPGGGRTAHPGIPLDLCPQTAIHRAFHGGRSNETLQPQTPDPGRGESPLWVYLFHFQRMFSPNLYSRHLGAAGVLCNTVL